MHSIVFVNLSICSFVKISALIIHGARPFNLYSHSTFSAFLHLFLHTQITDDITEIHKVLINKVRYLPFYLDSIVVQSYILIQSSCQKI